MNEEEEDITPFRSNLIDQIDGKYKTAIGITGEVGAGIATDAATTPLLAMGPLGWAGYGAINFGQGAYANYLAQKYAYDRSNVNWGEVISSGLFSIIPFMNVGVGKGASKFVGKAGTLQRGIVGGALTGLAGEQVRVGIDEQRFLDPLEASIAAGVGGGLSGGLTQLSKLGKKPNVIPKFDPTGATDDLMRQRAGLKMRLLHSIDPESADAEFGLGKTIKEQDDALMERYKEITNPDSRVTDIKDPNYGSLISDATAASDEYGRSARAFYNLTKVSRKGRIFDLRTGEFNLKELKRRYPSDADADFRREVQALAADERFGIGTFKRIRGEQLEDWLRGIEDIAPHINSKEFETHHIRSIRHVGALLDGMTRKQRVKFNNIMLKKMFYVGNNPENLILLNKKAHTRLHDKLNNEIGKYAQKYIDPDVVYSFEEKIEIAEKMGEIINRLTFEAYEEVADFMAEKFTIASPSARMAADIDIAELEARVDFVLDEYFRYLNRDGLGVIQSRIKDLEYETEVRQVQQDTEPPDRRLWRLKRGKGKKTLERIKKFEELYGKQLKLNI